MLNEDKFLTVKNILLTKKKLTFMQKHLEITQAIIILTIDFYRIKINWKKIKYPWTNKFPTQNLALIYLSRNRNTSSLSKPVRDLLPAQIILLILFF